VANFLTATERVQSVEQVQMNGSGPPEVVVIAVNQPNTQYSGFVSQRLLVLAWDSYAHRWTAVFDSNSSSTPYINSQLDAPDNSLQAAYIPSSSNSGAAAPPQAPLWSQMKILPIADQPNGGHDLLFSVVPFSASGAGMAGIIHYGNQTASIVWGYSTGDGVDISIAGKAPHQEAVVSTEWDTSADPHCCGIRTFSAVLKVEFDKYSPGSDSYKVVKDTRPWLGAWVYSASTSSPSTLFTFSPAVVISTTPGSPAASVLKQGDILEGVVGAKQPSGGQGDIGPAIVDQLAEQNVGQTVTLEVNRGGQMITVPVRLGSRSASDAIDAEPPDPGDLGISGSTMTSALASQYSLPNSQGVLVDSTVSGGPADNAGIEEEDIITSVGGYPTPNFDDLTIAVCILGVGASVQVNYVDTSGVSQSAEVTLGTPSTDSSEYTSFDYL
jgi:hypothetical protein